MDPFVDFMGIPKAATNSNGDEVIRYIRPEHLVNLDVEAMFFDEINRSRKQIRNAIMELLQFKTLNGQAVFPNLKFIWAAVNPDSDKDEDAVYDTERLDPAQRDRFQVHVEIPFECDQEYFTKKFGKDNARAAIAWWKEIPKQVKDLVSPRRLDYALEMQQIGGDVRDILPQQSNPTKLLDQLRFGSLDDNIRIWAEQNKIEEVRKFMANANNYGMAKDKILKSPHIGFYLPLVPKEHLSALFVREEKVREIVYKKHKKDGEYNEFLEGLKQTKVLQSQEQATQLAKALAERKAIMAGTVGLKTPQQIINDLGRGRTKEQAYADIMKLWEKTKPNLSTMIEDDQRSWYMLVLNITEGRWEGPLMRDMPGIFPLIRELYEAHDLTSFYPKYSKLMERLHIV